MVVLPPLLNYNSQILLVMKKTLFFICMCFATVATAQTTNRQHVVSYIANAQDSKLSDYYWYNDTKISLERSNQEYIIFDDAQLSNLDKEKLVESGKVSYTERDDLKWGITKPNAVIEDSEHVLYKAPSYKGSDNSNIYLTHRFYVKLKDSNDLSLLQDMNEQYNIEIEEYSKASLWYILRCGLPSSLNALELANIFYESGLFSAAEPEFMGGFSPETAVEQVFNHQYDTTKKKIYNGFIIIEVDGRKYNLLGLNIR